jgi:hypothetical protein
MWTGLIWIRKGSSGEILWSRWWAFGCHIKVGIIGPPSLLSNGWVAGALSLGVKRPMREADYSPPSTSEVKECVELYLHYPNTPSWRGASLSIGTTLPFTRTLILHTTRFSWQWYYPENPQAYLITNFPQTAYCCLTRNKLTRLKTAPSSIWK